MSKRRTLVLTFLLLSGSALADDFVGQASVVDGDTLDCASGSGVSTRRRAANCAAARTVCNIAAARRLQTTSIPSSLVVRLTACRSTSTHMAARSQPVRLAAPISANGSFATALRWIGCNTRKADMTPFSAMPNAPAAESGKGATSSRGFIAPASARAESQPRVRMTPVLIRDRSSRRHAHRLHEYQI
jgi:hypothetical protein